MKKTLATLLCIGMTGCASLEHTASEKRWLGAMVTAQASDYLTTDYILEDGGREQSPLYDDAQDVLIGKIAMTGLLFSLGCVFPKYRKTIYQAGFIGGAIPTALNGHEILEEER